MKDFGAYWLALKPRTGLWFILTIVALAVPAPITFASFRARGITPSRAEVWPMSALELSVVALVLFVSGYVAWIKEHAKTRDKWPRLSLSMREAIVEQQLPFNTAPQPLITAHD